MTFDTESSNDRENTPPKDRADFWVDMLRTKGIGCLSGKFKKEWRVNGQPVDSERPSSFEAIGSFGNSEVKQISYYIPAEYISSEVTRHVSEEQRVQANYFVISPSLKLDDADKFLAQKLQLSGDLSSASYEMWGDKDSVPDSRGHSIPFNFAFILPTTQLLELFNEVKQKPELIEEIFQRMYSGLTGKEGLVRKTVQKVRILEIPRNYAQMKTEYYPLKRFFNNPQEYMFQKPIGEG